MTSQRIFLILFLVIAIPAMTVALTGCEKSGSADESGETPAAASAVPLCERVKAAGYESELRDYSGDLWVARKNTSNLTHNSVIDDEVLQRIAGLEGVKTAARRYLAELTLKTGNGVTSHQVYGEDPAFFEVLPGFRG